MLLLPKTPPLTYPNMKRFKDQKRASLHFTHFSHFSLHNHSLRSFSFQEVEVVGERRWLLHSQSKKVLKENTARARLARVWIKGYPFKNFLPASIFQRNPFQNFFHSIFFPGKSLVKNSKLTFNFTWKSPIKNFLHFLHGNPFAFCPKNYFWVHFSKSHRSSLILEIFSATLNLAQI